jgi:hypothetical protein
MWIVESAAACFCGHANSERDGCPDGHGVANGNTERHADASLPRATHAISLLWRALRLFVLIWARMHVPRLLLLHPHAFAYEFADWNRNADTDSNAQTRMHSEPYSHIRGAWRSV